jgi:hypothetical protein
VPATRKPAASYDNEALGALAYEFSFSDPAEAEELIRKRLERKKLGPYAPARIDVLRAFKNDVQREIGQDKKSAYFTGRHGRYVDARDFDVPRLARDMIARYPQIPPRVIERFIPFAVLIYYLK